MTDQGKTIPALPVQNAVSDSDRLVILYNAANATTAQTATIAVSDYETRDISTDPANSSVTTIPAGRLFFSNGYLYFSTANNHVKRVALSDF